MWTKRILILLPVVVCLFLLQSYFWVPTYEQQARATPDRLSQYITSSIGDAKTLNPILHADSASGTICGRVFEGLIDRDRDLNWRGRLAESWEIFEEAYFVVDPKGSRSPDQIAALIRSEKAKRKDEDSVLGECLRNITQVEVLPAETATHTVTEEVPNEKDKAAKSGEKKERDAKKDEETEEVKVTITVRRPSRIKLTLKKVDQYLFDTLGEVVGREYFASFKGAEYVEVSPAQFAGNKAKYAKQFVPATEHNPVLIFHLRKGVKFHDGHEFDAGDVKFTYEAIVDVKNRSPRISSYEPVKSVEVVDKYTVRIVYKELHSPGFGSWGMQILPEHLLNEERMRAEAKEKDIPFDEFNMRKTDFNRKPVGCGPFEFVRWESDEFIELVRFDDYWEGPPEYREYVYRVLPDVVTQEMEFYAGAVDDYAVQPNQAERLRQDDRFQSFSDLSLGYTYIGYNMRRDLFKDKRVRRALSMAIDIKKIIRYVMYNQAERMTGPFPLQTDFCDKTIEPIPFDPQGAVRLLGEAGWQRNPANNDLLEKDGKPFRFTLITNLGNRVRKDVTEIAQHYWKRIGIDVDIEIIEWSVFLSHVDTGDFDACVLGWGMDIEPDLYEIWHSSQNEPHQLNFVAFKNGEADDLIIRIRQEYDHEKQVELCHRLHRIIADEQPYTFLYVARWTSVRDRRLVTVRRDKDGKIIGYEKIKTNKLGQPDFDFNRWVKLPKMPELLLE